MNDPRIGTIENGVVTSHPEADVYGQAYSRPATTKRLDKSHFVVLPANFVDSGILDELAALVQPKVTRKASIDKPVVKESETSEDDKS